MRTVSSPWTSLSYDALDRLAGIDSTNDTNFAYDGLDMIAEYSPSGTMQARYVHGPGMDQPLVRYDGSGTSNKQSLHADERGSLVAATYGAPYAPTINKYDEFGKPQSTNVGRFQYTGQMWLPEAGLYHYKARDYAPHLGRFLQPDPIGYEDSANLYAYVVNDPVNLVDPLGLDWVTSCVPSENYCVTYWEPDVIATGFRNQDQSAGGIPRTSPGPRRRRPSADADLSGGGASSDKPEPAYCRKQGYKALDSLDKLLGKAQWAAIAWGLLGQTEHYEVHKKAAGRGAVRAYHYLAGGRALLNLGKAAYGDYRGSVTNAIFGIGGRAAGLDQISDIAADQLADQIDRRLGASPCQ